MIVCVDFTRICIMQISGKTSVNSLERDVTTLLHHATKISYLRYALTYYCLLILKCTPVSSGHGSSVGITTELGLDGPGSNPGGDEIFRPSRPALWPTQPPVKWVTGLPRG